MTEMFEFTSLARKLAPFNEDEDATVVSFAEINEEGETGSKVVVKRKKPEELAIFWDEHLIIASSNHLVESFDRTYFERAKDVLQGQV